MTDSLISNQVVITGMGLCTSLGGVASSCAAARAGLARPKPLESASAFDENEGELIPVAGFPAVDGLLGLGFEGLGKQAALLEFAARDFIAYSPGSLEKLNNAPLIMVQSSRYYERELWLQELTALNSQTLDPLALVNGKLDEYRGKVESKLIAAVNNATGLTFGKKGVQFLWGHHTAFYDAITQAMEMIAEGQTCVAVAISDSLLGETTLSTLIEGHLIKTEENIDGFMPAEGAALFLLESEHSALTRYAPVQAHIDGVSVAEEDVSIFSDEPQTGRALMQAISGLPGLDSGISLPVSIGNLAGDRWRATDFGQALVNLVPLHQSEHWYTGETFGELGCVSPALAVIMAIRGMIRSYISSSCVPLWTSGDDGKKGALLVSRR